MFKVVREQTIDTKIREIKMLEESIQESRENPEAMRDLEHRRKGEIKELVTLQNAINTMEYAHIFLQTEDP